MFHRIVGIGVLIIVGLVLVSGLTMGGLMPIHKSSGITLLPDQCTKASPVLKAGSLFLVPAKIVHIVGLFLFFRTNLSEDTIPEDLLPDEPFRPPCH